MGHAQQRIAIVAPTYPDARDTCVEGESGLLACLPQERIRTWNRSLGELILTNGTVYKLFSADKPDRLRGPQHHRAWCDELGSWRYPEAWDMLMFGLRLGDDPRAVVTTTPKPMKSIRALTQSASTMLTRGTSYENRDNLPPSWFDQIIRKYEGTRLGRQELEGQLLDDVPGALWQRAQIDETRRKYAPDLARVVVAIDPAVTSGEDADETGIIVAGRGVDGQGYVLADLTCRLSPDGWARRAIAGYREYKADRIIAEVNNGGEMVEHTVHTVDKKIPFKAVHASRGKVVRAEPIAALYEQGRIHHVGTFEDLEDQQCCFTPDNIAGNSPDRVDALVWALTELFLEWQAPQLFVPNQDALSQPSYWRGGNA